MTHHAQYEIYDDDLTMIDVERALLSGERVEKQRDAETGEMKYSVHGASIGGPIEVVLKFGPDGELTILTVFSLYKEN